MKNVHIKGETGIYLTPEIKLNAKTGICEIIGESYLENTVAFYAPIIRWITEYSQQEISHPLIFNFRLTYFNTSSSKAILEILLLLKSLENQGISIGINWYYPDDDFDLLAEAEDFIDDSEIEFNLIPYKLDY